MFKPTQRPPETKREIIRSVYWWYSDFNPYVFYGWCGGQYGWHIQKFGERSEYAGRTFKDVMAWLDPKANYRQALGILPTVDYWCFVTRSAIEHAEVFEAVLDGENYWFKLTSAGELWGSRDPQTFNYIKKVWFDDAAHNVPVRIRPSDLYTVFVKELSNG